MLQIYNVAKARDHALLFVASLHHGLLCALCCISVQHSD